MNILTIGPIPPSFGGPSFGGVATHIEGLTNALVSKNHTVSLWYHKPQKKQTLHNITIIPNSLMDYIFSVFVALKYSFKKELNYLTYKERLLLGFQMYRLKKIMRRNVFNNIHVHSLHNTSVIALKYLNNQIPIVITDHGFWHDSTVFVINTPSYKKLKDVVAQCNKVVYISNYAKCQHEKINFGQNDKLIKIKNPIVVTDKITKRLKPSDKKVVFFNGLTESLKIKQLDVLLKAIQDDEYLRHHIKVIAIANRDAQIYVSNNKFDFEIELHSASPWDKVKGLYKRSNLFVLPSKSESFGLAYLEALSFGLPIIAFEEVFNEFKSNISDYIGEPFNSETETSAQLAEKIKIVLSTNFNYDSVYTSLKKEYDWQNSIIHYESIYKNVEGKGFN